MARAITVESVCPLRLQRGHHQTGPVYPVIPFHHQYQFSDFYQLAHLIWKISWFEIKHLQLGVTAVLQCIYLVMTTWCACAGRRMVRGWSVMRHYPDGTITRGAHALCMYDSTRDCQTHYRDENKTEAILGHLFFSWLRVSYSSYYCVCNTHGVSYHWE